MPTVRRLALEAHSALDDYLRVHEAMFVQTEGVLVPCYLGAAEYEEYAAVLGALVERLGGIRGHLMGTEVDEADGTDGPQFRLALVNFVSALRAAVAELRAICEALRPDDGAEPCSCREYHGHMRSYQQLRELYQGCGVDLNRAFQRRGVAEVRPAIARRRHGQPSELSAGSPR